MEELKPCPFCGGKATLIKTRAYTTGAVLYHVWHHELKCTMREMRTENHETADLAIESWNRRET